MGCLAFEYDLIYYVVNRKFLSGPPPKKKTMHKLYTLYIFQITERSKR